MIIIAGVIFVALLAGGAYIATIAGYGHRYQTAYVINDSDLSVVAVVDSLPPVLVEAGERGTVSSTPYGSSNRVTILTREWETLGSTEYSGSILISVDRNRHVQFEHNADLSDQPIGDEFPEAKRCAAADASVSIRAVRSQRHAYGVDRPDELRGEYADVRIDGTGGPCRPTAECAGTLLP